MTFILELYQSFGCFKDSIDLSGKKLGLQWAERYDKLAACCNKFDQQRKCPVVFIHRIISEADPYSTRKINNVCPIRFALKHKPGKSISCTAIGAFDWGVALRTIDDDILIGVLPSLDRWLKESIND